MDEAKILELVKRALAEQKDKTADMDPAALARSLGEVVNGQVETQVREQIAAALKERDEANAAAEKLADRPLSSKRDTNKTARDDVAQALVLAVGEFARRISHPPRRLRWAA